MAGKPLLFFNAISLQSDLYGKFIKRPLIKISRLKIMKG